MNERIKTLIEQATTHIPPVPGKSGEGWIFDKEKFAELIVRECAKVCDDTVKGTTVELVGRGFADAITRHFGIESGVNIPPLGMPAPRYPAADISFNEGDKVTLKDGRQGRIYKLPSWGHTAELRGEVVYVYFFPKGKRDPDLVEAVPLTDFMPDIGWK